MTEVKCDNFKIEERSEHSWHSQHDADYFQFEIDKKQSLKLSIIAGNDRNLMLALDESKALIVASRPDPEESIQRSITACLEPGIYYAITSPHQIEQGPGSYQIELSMSSAPGIISF